MSKLIWYPHYFWTIGSLLQNSPPREKEKKAENFHNACIDTFSCGQSPPFKNPIFFKKIIIMSIFTNGYITYLCDPLGLYISQVNYSIDPIIAYWSTFIKYL